MVGTPATPSPNKRKIILDTNIISRLDGNLGLKLFEVINEVVALGYEITISDITFMELLTGADSKQEIKITETLKGVDHYLITTQVTIASAHITSLYKALKDIGDIKQFEMGDRIIAGTAALHSALVFTLNGRDYPAPFFKEIDRRKLEYENKGMPICSYAYFMEPQLDIINESHNKRLGITPENLKNIIDPSPGIDSKKTDTLPTE